MFRVTKTVARSGACVASPPVLPRRLRHHPFLLQAEEEDSSDEEEISIQPPVTVGPSVSPPAMSRPPSLRRRVAFPCCGRIMPSSPAPPPPGHTEVGMRGAGPPAPPPPGRAEAGTSEARPPASPPPGRAEAGTRGVVRGHWPPGRQAGRWHGGAPARAWPMRVLHTSSISIPPTTAKNYYGEPDGNEKNGINDCQGVIMKLISVQTFCRLQCLKPLHRSYLQSNTGCILKSLVPQ
uniref:Uncharacterized protein n=1 Tax=Leersia perrieri TaxID=77586 RepID=A0A0D9XZU8_9ORYZ